MTQSIDSSKEQTDIRFGRDELIIQNRYETAILFNDFLIALWFILGSVFFIVPGLAREPRHKSMAPLADRFVRNQGSDSKPCSLHGESR